ncbi:hypothetical protein [Streptomyces sp. NPDC006551]|uniref:hypothetical protein n=1 Tax=Streptomyces sp. NPDC006551 TaxID=3157178 RepID=UPI0033A639F3
MLRHAIAPAARFTQIPNEILRHPRLNADAVRLLSWQLSLPDGVDEPLSKTAERASIGKISFLRAKGQLKAEGYVHEWREQGERGLWRTRQLVSNVPLSPAEAALVRAPEHVPAPAPAPPPAPAPAPVTAASPAIGLPAAGEPSVRSVGRHPDKTSGGNTSNPPPPPPPEARRAVDDLASLDPRLRVPRAMLPELAGLAARWLEAGHSIESLRSGIARCLPARGEPVHRPGGLVRYILRDVPPPRLDPPPAAPPLSAVASMRECEADRHVQPMLFRPVGDETLCAACRQDQAAGSAPASPAPFGAALARTALRTGVV